MTDIFKIKKNDINPALSVALQYNDGTAVNLSGTNTAVWFIMGNKDYSSFYSGTCIITGSTSGECKYEWSTGSGELGSQGTYWGEFEINWNAGSKMTLPSDHSLQIEVYEDYN